MSHTTHGHMGLKKLSGSFRGTKHIARNALDEMLALREKRLGCLSGCIEIQMHWNTVSVHIASQLTSLP